ncbi:MAG: hypothetical protein QM687_03050 [Ferruginibacter sp.]
MKCMVITYIKSEHTLTDIEGLMDFLHFRAIESNSSYRVFSGTIRMNLSNFVNRVNNQLRYTQFDTEDSMFIVYPIMNEDGYPSMSNIIIKRKGNRYLRKS